MGPKWRNAIAGAGLGFALLLGALGQVVTFVPGAQANWFGVAACSAVLGLFFSKGRIRILALGLALGLAWLSWDGYREGVRYREFLQQRDPP